ncbi:MAG: pitrilysin family protein [Ignavibacteria bacterium]|nr:pitrilysin family protein [Ignavibacteria bacterium]
MIAKFSLTFLITLLLVVVLSISSFAQFKLPQYEKFELENGLTFYLMEKHDVPLISFSAVFNAGAERDGEHSGIASFTADALRFGTASYTKIQIDSLFNFYGSNLTTYTTLDYAGLSTTIMKERANELLPIIKEVISSPTFPEEEIIKRKQRWLAELDQAKESPRTVIGSYYNKLIFGDAPYGNPVDGTKAGIEKLTRNDVEEFYSFNYNPSSSTISVVGDFEIGEMKTLLSDLFVDWKPNPNLVIGDLIMNELPFDESTVYLIDKSNATETTFLIGGYGIKMSNEDQTQIDVINTILGGRFTSWLNDELRVNAGLTYGARSRFKAYKQSGIFYIYSFTATKNTEAAIDLAIKTYNRLFEKGIDEETLTSAKNYVKGQFPPDYETASALANLLCLMYVYGLTDSYINDFENKVDAMTVERANRLIKRYFPKEKLQFTLIGKADEIRDVVKKYGKIIERDITEDGF